MSDSNRDDYIVGELRDVKDSVDELRRDTSSMDKTLTEYKTTFDHHMRQDELMFGEFKRMNDILLENTQSLKEHIHRTALLEDHYVKMDNRLNPLEIESIKRKAVKEWTKNSILFLAKIVGGAAALVAVIAAIKAMM